MCGVATQHFLLWRMISFPDESFMITLMKTVIIFLGSMIT
jgi:hypothetical protein